MNYLKKIKLGRNNSIYFKKSKKFKTIGISIVYKLKYNHKNVSAFNILAKYLGNCSNNYPSIEKLNKYIESLYGTLIGIKSNYTGSLFTFNIYANFINEKYIDDKDISEKVIKLLHDMIYNPLIIDGKLDDSIFEICKENCLLDVETLKEHNMDYVIKTLKKKLISDEHSSFNVHTYGEKKVLKELDNKNILKYYNKLLKAPFDIYVTGDFSYSKMEKLIRKYYKNKKSSSLKYSVFEKIESDETEPTYIKSPVSQAKVAIAYKIPILFNDDRHYAFRVARLILSGTLSSKFGKEIREKQGLCYYISSNYSSYYGGFIVTTGVASENVKKVVSEVDKQINEVKKGNITDEEIYRSKESLINNLKMLDDSLFGVLNMINIYHKFDRTFILEDEIKKYEAVSKNDIVEASKLLTYCTYVVLDKEQS